MLLAILPPTISLSPYDSDQDLVVSVSSEECDLDHLNPIPEEPFSIDHIREAFDILFHRVEKKQCVKMQS